MTGNKRLTRLFPGEAVENFRVGSRIGHRSWIGFSQQALRKLPGSFAIGFGRGKIPFREENASHVVIDRAGGQALIECLRGLLRCLAEFADSESHCFLQMVFGMHVIALQASKCTQQSQCLEPDPLPPFRP